MSSCVNWCQFNEGSIVLPQTVNVLPTKLTSSPTSKKTKTPVKWSFLVKATVACTEFNVLMATSTMYCVSPIESTTVTDCTIRSSLTNWNEVTVWITVYHSLVTNCIWKYDHIHVLGVILLPLILYLGVYPRYIKECVKCRLLMDTSEAAFSLLFFFIFLLG